MIPTRSPWIEGFLPISCSELTPDHGAPVRLRIPRQVGYKNLKYIARISVTDSLKNIGDGNGSAAPEIGYLWYGGI